MPYTARGWPRNAGLIWPSLRFADRSIALAELRDVWVSGNDGVVTDAQCRVYLPSHGHQIPLHLNLPTEPLDARREDPSIRVLGADDRGAAADRGDEVILLSLAQVFSANF